VWSNAMTYNKPNNVIYLMAKALRYSYFYYILLIFITFFLFLLHSSYFDSELFEKSYTEAVELDKPKPSISKKEIKKIANELNVS
jgi:hypothetical protein